MQTSKCQTSLDSLQSTGLLYFDTYWYILVCTLYILVHTWSVLSMYKGIPRMILQYCCAALVQDTVLVVPPYPYCIEELEDPHDVALEETSEGNHA
jgi:hypothetical protein